MTDNVENIGQARGLKDGSVELMLRAKADDLDPDIEDADRATARGSDEAATSHADEWVRVNEPRSR